MKLESMAILVICLAFCLIEAKSGQLGCAVADLPIGVVPGMYLLARVLASPLGKMFGLSTTHLYAATILISVVVASVGSALLCTFFIQSKKTRRAHMGLCIGFSTLLAMIYMFKIVL